jgi:hypothetical protein
VQRALDVKAKTALDLAIGQNAHGVSQDFVEGEPIGSLSYTQAKDVVDKQVPLSEQKELTDVGGGGVFSKLKGVQVDIRDFVRAYVLKGFAQPLDSLTSDPEKAKRKPKGATAAKEWEQSNHKRYFGIAKNVRDQYKPLVNMRSTAPEVQAFLRSEGLEAGMGGSDEEKAGELAKGPRIDVRSSYSGSQRDKVRMRIHLFIVYTATDGKQWYIRGGPGEEVDDPELGFLEDGYVTADVGRYIPGSVDWDPAADSVTALKGAEASDKFDAMVEAASACSSAKVPYKMLTKKMALEGENCNATAWTVLKRAGVPTKRPSGVHPGWGKELGRQSSVGRALEERKDKTPKVTFAKKVGIAGAELFKDRAGADVLENLAAGTGVTVLEEIGDFVKVKVAGGTVKIGWMSASTFAPDKVHVIPKSTPPKPLGNPRPALLAGKNNEIVGTYHLDKDLPNQDLFLDGNKPIEVLDDSFQFGRPDLADKLFLVQQKVFGKLEQGRIKGAQILPAGGQPTPPKVPTSNIPAKGPITLSNGLTITLDQLGKLKDKTLGMADVFDRAYIDKVCAGAPEIVGDIEALKAALGVNDMWVGIALLAAIKALEAKPLAPPKPVVEAEDSEDDSSEDSEVEESPEIVDEAEVFDLVKNAVARRKVVLPAPLPYKGGEIAAGKMIMIVGQIANGLIRVDVAGAGPTDKLPYVTAAALVTATRSVVPEFAGL